MSLQERWSPAQYREHFATHGSLEQHRALVEACRDVLGFAGWPVATIATTGIPVPRADGSFALRDNPDQVGLSDLLTALPGGRGVLLECKTGKARRTHQQRELQDRFARQGFLYLTVRDLRAVTDLIAAHPAAPRRGGAL